VVAAVYCNNALILRCYLGTENDGNIVGWRQEAQLAEKITDSITHKCVLYSKFYGKKNNFKALLKILRTQYITKTSKPTYQQQLQSQSLRTAPLLLE